MNSKELFYKNFEEREQRIKNQNISQELKETLLENLMLEKKIYEQSEKNLDQIRRGIYEISKIQRNNKNDLNSVLVQEDTIEKYFTIKRFNVIDRYHARRKIRGFSEN